MRTWTPRKLTGSQISVVDLDCYAAFIFLEGVTPVHFRNQPRVTSILATPLRLRQKIEPILRKNQNGFRPGRSTLGQILTLRRIIEEITHCNKTAALIFVDFSSHGYACSSRHLERNGLFYQPGRALDTRPFT